MASNLPQMKSCFCNQQRVQNLVYPRNWPARRERNRLDKEDASYAAIEELRPWVEIIAELLQDSQLRQSHIGPITQSYIPHQYQDAKELQSLIPREPSLQEFHRFRQLPPELRQLIWQFAAWEPPHLIGWMKRDPPSRCGRRRRRDMSRAVMACREAWATVRAQGGRYFHDLNGIQHWTAPQDVVFLDEGADLCATAQSWTMDFLLSRETIAVRYSHWLNSAADEDKYAWLRRSQALKTLLFVLCKPIVHVDRDPPWPDRGGRASDEVEGPSRERRCDLHLAKLVTFDQAEDLEKLESLWQQISPYPQTISVSKNPVSYRGAPEHTYDHASRCLKCESRRFEDELVENAKKKWRSLAPGNGDGSITGPKVVGASLHMPKFKGAVHLIIDDL
ncbi:hypothetical protein PG988_013491 [Apiospora saccharicola]